MTRWLSVLLVVAACKKSSVENSGDAVLLHPDLHCPVGTVPAGTPPPRGQEVYCLEGNGAGRWYKQGQTIGWHSNEVKAFDGQYQSDRRDGQWTYYFANGTLEKQGAFAGGVENGPWLYYHPSGNPKAEGTMVDGKEHGTWFYWDEAGAKTEGQWNLGARDGVWLDYDAAGNAVQERTFKAGRMIGMRDL